jgi:flavin reductase
MIDRTMFREAMANLGAAVCVVTTAGREGLGGFTATAVCSVTDDPPTLLVCMNRSARQYQRFAENRVLCVNVLNAEQQEISAMFAGLHSIEKRFALAQWQSLKTGAPAIDDALVSIDCAISHSRDVGSHAVFFCEVKHIRMGQHEAGLLYFRRRYGRLG